MSYDTATHPGLTAEHIKSVLDQVQALIESGLSQAEIARQSGLQPSAMTETLKGRYTGTSLANAIGKLERWLLTRAQRLAALTEMPVAPEWYATPTAARIERTLNYAQVAPDFVVVIGGAGQSKTTTCRRYALDWPNVWHVEFEAPYGRQLAALQLIAAAVGERGSLPAAPAPVSTAIKARIRGTRGLLILDEAQHLDVATLEAVRGLHDATGIGVALVGNESLYHRLTGGAKAADRAQLFSRIGRRLQLTSPAPGDVAALADAWGVQDIEARKVLAAIAAKPGALRVVTKTLRLAAVMAGGQPIGAAVLKSAWSDLGMSA